MDYKELKELNIKPFTDNIVGYVKYKNGSGDYVISWTELRGIYGENLGLTCYEFITMNGSVHRLRTGTEPFELGSLSTLFALNFDFYTRGLCLDDLSRPEEHWHRNDNILEVFIIQDGYEKEFRNVILNEELKKKGVAASFQEQGRPTESLKDCTDDRCTENRYGYRCPHCQSLNIREISGHHDEGAPYGTIGYECTDCHTTFTVDVFDEAALKQENERLKQELEETKKELEEAQLLTTVLKKEIDNLKWEKTWYEAHYTMKKNQFKEAMRLLKNAEFFMNSGQDIHSMYPQWVKSYYSTLNNIKEFINKKED